MNRDQSKAVRYIQQLDQARCDGDWNAVPELVRKLRKHAPQRSCLALTAECEYTITQASTSPKPTKNGPNASSLGHLIAPLSEAIRTEKSFLEDEFQARVCLGWIYWVRAEPALACSQLSTSIEQDFAQLDGSGMQSAGWTKICAVKASYIKGASLNSIGASEEALDTFQSALPIVWSISTKSSTGTREQRIWTELLLTEFCMLSSQTLNTKISSITETDALSAFRAWARFWEHGQGSSPAGGYAASSEISRRQIWKEYYVALSKILQQGLPYPTTSMATAYRDSSTRNQQQAELKSVESNYETLLLKEVQFPKADQTSDEVEQWSDLVVKNWVVLCGSSWLEGDQDHSRKEGISRRVLDILYRAATKTFHSTAILRHLFTLHLAVGEFDLAFKAFDTYIEIVKKGKARVGKSGEIEKSLDSDETVLSTVSKCITALCRYGSQEAAAKAKDLAQYFEEWLNKHHPSNVDRSQHDRSKNINAKVNGNASQPLNSVSPQVFALVWRSIGIAKAQWARVTYDAGSRSEIQLSAIESLRRALLPEYNSMNDVETLFALAMILSERRELDGAIEVVKRALLPQSTSLNGTAGHLNESRVRFDREKSLIALWHLLALLLSARQDYTTAARACEGAFEQFQDPKTLFGDSLLGGTYRSEHLNLQDINEKIPSQRGGVVDEMDDCQKETVLEVKMTQLALIELLEGPDVAVNASDELLSLYSRLFGEPQKSLTPTPSTAQTLPPQSSAGTLRSIKGSLFGRSRPSVRKSSVTRGRTSPISENSILPIRPQTAHAHASTVKKGPAIHVTNEDGGTASRPHHHEKLHKRRSASLSRKKSYSSLRNRSTSEGPSRAENRTPSAVEITESYRTSQQQDEKSMSPQDDEVAMRLVSVTNSTQTGQISAPENLSAALPIAHDGPQRALSKRLTASPQAILQKEEPQNSNPMNQQDHRMPNAVSQSSSNVSFTRFSKDQQRRRRIEILVRLWLLIAGFYRRAEMYEDAKGAIDEAYKLVEGQEKDVSRDTSGYVTIDSGGWGSIKSVEELWGDVWSERGYLSVAKGLPYTALSDFEAALAHCTDHPSAIVGLSNILLDIYAEILSPTPSIPSVVAPSPTSTPSNSILNASTLPQQIMSPVTSASVASSALPNLQPGPLGLANPKITSTPLKFVMSEVMDSTALLDRLAARDRAYGLLLGLTKLGVGWNYSEAWFALARAQEEAGLVDKARDALWWCVELEEARGIRSWNCVGAGGYVL